MVACLMMVGGTISGWAQVEVTPWDPRTDADPSVQLAQDLGSAGLHQALMRIGTTASLMQTTAHPDDGRHVGNANLLSVGLRAQDDVFNLPSRFCLAPSPDQDVGSGPG